MSALCSENWRALRSLGIAALLWIAHARPATAGIRVETVTAQITGPMRTGKAQARYVAEFGPSIAMPLPRADIGNAELGIRVGASFTKMTENGGVGLDVTYHYWPVSDRFKSNMSTLLRQATFNSIELGGTTWRPRALSATVHARLVAPFSGAVRPCLKLGAGVFRVDPNTAGFSGDAGFFSIKARPLKKFLAPGVHATLGVDWRTGPRVRLGLAATCDRVFCKERFGSDLTVITVGSHVLFGKP